MVLIRAGILMSVKSLQFEKALYPIHTIVGGSVTFDRSLQSRKAHESILVTPSGILIEVRDKQSWNVYGRISLMPAGKIIDFSSVQPSKACAPRLLTLEGRLMFDKDSQYSNAPFSIVSCIGKRPFRQSSLHCLE